MGRDLSTPSGNIGQGAPARMASVVITAKSNLQFAGSLDPSMVLKRVLVCDALKNRLHDWAKPRREADFSGVEGWR